MGRVTKKEVAEAAQAVGLRLPARMSARSEWTLLEVGTGKPVFSDRSLASLLQYCRDRQAAQAAPESMPGGDPPVVGVPAVVVDAERTEGAALADGMYGDGDLYDRSRLVAEVRGYLGSGVMAMLEAGRRLIRLKEHEEHGSWLSTLEEIGIHPRAAQRMMLAARKFLPDGRSDTVSFLPSSITAAYEIAALDDDDLEELREGGTIAGATLDDIQRMSPSELRAALRAERQERREREQAQRERLAKKEQEIDGLEESLRRRKRYLDQYRYGNVAWTRREQDLLDEAAFIEHRVEDVFRRLKTSIERLEELAADEAGHAKAGEIVNAMPLDGAILVLKERFAAIMDRLGTGANEIGELLSWPLPTEGWRAAPASADSGSDS